MSSGPEARIFWQEIDKIWETLNKLAKQNSLKLD
jgi:hypothetical protein